MLSENRKWLFIGFAYDLVITMQSLYLHQAVALETKIITNKLALLTKPQSADAAAK